MKPTPTTHGAWRVINGQLVDEASLDPAITGDGAAVVPLEPAATPLIASTDLREGGPDIAVPPADAPNPSKASGRRSTTQSKESPNGTA